MITGTGAATQRFGAIPLDEIDIAGLKTGPVSSPPAAFPFLSCAEDPERLYAIVYYHGSGDRDGCRWSGRL